MNLKTAVDRAWPMKEKRPLSTSVKYAKKSEDLEWKRDSPFR